MRKPPTTEDIRNELDEALKATFPASDAVSIVQPKGAKRDEGTTGQSAPPGSSANVPRLALHPPIWLKGCEAIRSLAELARALIKLAPLDPGGTAILRRRVNAADTPQAADHVGRDFRAWARARELLLD